MEDAGFGRSDAATPRALISRGYGATFLFSPNVVRAVTNETAVEFIEEWQAGFFFIIGCFVGGVSGSFLFAQLDWNAVVGFVLGVGFVFLGASYVLYGR